MPGQLLRRADNQGILEHRQLQIDECAEARDGQAGALTEGLFDNRSHVGIMHRCSSHAFAITAAELGRTGAAVASYKVDSPRGQFVAQSVETAPVEEHWRGLRQ